MRFREEGESGLLTEWPGLPEAERRLRILALHERLLADRPSWLEEAIPGMSTLLIVYDPRMAGPETVRGLVETLGDDPSSLPPPRTVEVPVKYGGPEGPDLDRVARHVGLGAEEVVARHAEAEYRVAFIGFSPGFPYLAGLPAALEVPRLDSPRTRVPAGSVAIGGTQAGIYPRSSPGGWNIIGRTPLRLCDWGRADPFLLRPGDRVVFVQTRAASFDSNEEAPGPPPSFDGVVEVVSPGLLTTIQDLGRPGHGHEGVPPSGPMDRRAFRLANLAAGNVEGRAALEFSFPAPLLRFLESCSFALAGADFSATLSGRPVPHCERVDARAGEEVRFEKNRSGQWAYLALAGGIACPRYLGSAATDLRSGLGARLPPGTRLSLEGAPPRNAPRVPAGLARIPAEGDPVRFMRAEGDPPPDLEGARVTLSLVRDRSGYRTGSPSFPAGGGAMLSEGIPPGTIQLPPDGKLIFLLSERPTTGGYRKVAFLASVDSRLVAQSRPGATVRLSPIESGEARRLAGEEEEMMEAIRGRESGPIT